LTTDDDKEEEEEEDWMRTVGYVEVAKKGTWVKTKQVEAGETKKTMTRAAVDPYERKRRAGFRV
jgi:lambda repressor-like predicted transcriptional regulator